MRLATSDLYESGYFLCGGARLAEVVPDRSGASPKLVFAFDGGDELGEMQRSYHCGTATVNLAEYRRSLEALKDIMFRHIRGASTRSNGGAGTRLNREERRRIGDGQGTVPAYQAVS